MALHTHGRVPPKSAKELAKRLKKTAKLLKNGKGGKRKPGKIRLPVSTPEGGFRRAPAVPRETIGDLPHKVAPLRPKGRKVKKPKKLKKVRPQVASPEGLRKAKKPKKAKKASPPISERTPTVRPLRDTSRFPKTKGKRLRRAL